MICVRTCTTQYLGPTNHRGARVQARYGTIRKRMTLPWDHALGILENHTAIARVALGGQPDWYSSTADGFIFGRDPDKR